MSLRSYVSLHQPDPHRLVDGSFIPPQLRELASTLTPFAVKGGGHATNPEFSSTPGVHISLIRFNNIDIHEDLETVEIGAGLTWTDVYTYLVPKGINVVGGRLGSVGVAGYTLGGGNVFSRSSVV
jgi:UDP-N-acetylenolpyruvoylglucosamine reductase